MRIIKKDLSIFGIPCFYWESIILRVVIFLQNADKLILKFGSIIFWAIQLFDKMV